MNEIVDHTIEYLKAIRSSLQRLENDVQDIKARIGVVEDQVIGVRRDQTNIHEVLSHHSKRFDRIDERLGRIEKRLDLVEA